MTSHKHSATDDVQKVIREVDDLCQKAEQVRAEVEASLRRKVFWPDRRDPHRRSGHQRQIDQRDVQSI